MHLTRPLHSKGPRCLLSLTSTKIEETAAGHRHLGIALIVISVAQLMVVLDSTIVNIAIPYIQKDLGFSAASTSMDHHRLHPRRSVACCCSAAASATSSAGAGSSWSASAVRDRLAARRPGAVTRTLLLGARVLQGVGAAIASPTALALITTTFPPGKPRNRAFAVYAAMSGAGAAVGLILGGWLTEYSWRWTFLINVPIGIAAAVAAPIFLSESARQRGSFDLGGALTGTLGLVSIVYGLTHASELVSKNAAHAWTAPVTLTALGLGVVLLRRLPAHRAARQGPADAVPDPRRPHPRRPASSS